MSADKQAKIKEALAKLDVANDSQWTEDGQPRIESMRMLTGVFNLSREEVTAADPNFSRTNTASAPAAQPSTTSELVGKDQAAAMQTATTPVETPPVEGLHQDEVAEPETNATDLEQQIDYEKDKLQRMHDARDEVINAIMAQERVIFDLEAQLPKDRTPEHVRSQEAIHGYLEQQKANLNDRARRMELFKNVDLSQLPRRAPIDEARMKARPGTKR